MSACAKCKKLVGGERVYFGGGVFHPKCAEKVRYSKRSRGRRKR